MMKIAIEAQRIFRKKKHGMDIVALELIRHLQAIDHENEYFILVRKDKDNRVLSETANFHIIELPHVSYPIWEQYYLPRALKKIAPDILHCTSNTAPLKIKIPLILTLHDILYLQRLYFNSGTWYQRFGNLYRRWIVPKIVANCTKIITVSNFEKKEIEQHFPYLKQDIVKTVYNANNDDYHNELDENKMTEYRKKLNLPDQFVLYLGNTDPKKNLINVLKAFALLNKKQEKKLHMVMPDVSRPHLLIFLKKIKEPGLSKFIHLTGYIPNNKLIYLYRMATVFLYPSFYESFGIPILEAMATGTPVITSATSAMPEIAGNAAILVDPHNPEEIADAILTVLANKNTYNTLKEDGIQRASQFSWNKSAKATLKIYQQVFLQKKQAKQNLILQ